MTDDDDTPIDDHDDEPEEPVASSGDVGNRRVVRRKAREQWARQDEDANFWKACLGSVIGRRVLFSVLNATHWSEVKFACGPNGFPQQEATWFHAGEQSIGERLWLSWFKIDPDNAMVMLRENDPRLKGEG